MNVVDMIVGGLLVVNAILGAVRGFALQAFKLGSIVLAVWLAHMFADDFASLAAPHLEWPHNQLVAFGWVVIGGVTYLTMLAVGHYAKGLLQRLRMGGADRALGTLLGGLKGLLIAAIGLAITTELISWGSMVIPDSVKNELKTSRAFEFYLKAVYPVSHQFVQKVQDEMARGALEQPEKPK
jgi:uncharacterized membrane protein required for colicin V production